MIFKLCSVKNLDKEFLIVLRLAEKAVVVTLLRYGTKALSSSESSLGCSLTTADITLGAGLKADGGTISIGITWRDIESSQ